MGIGFGRVVTPSGGKTQGWVSKKGSKMAAAASSVFAVAVPGTAVAELPTQVNNLEHTVELTWLPDGGHGLMVFMANEADQGNDLNGDGAIGTNNVLQLWDSVTGEIHSLIGFATSTGSSTGVLQPSARLATALPPFRSVNPQPESTSTAMAITTTKSSISGPVLEGSSIPVLVSSGAARHSRWATAKLSSRPMRPSCTPS